MAPVSAMGQPPPMIIKLATKRVVARLMPVGEVLSACAECGDIVHAGERVCVIPDQSKLSYVCGQCIWYGWFWYLTWDYTRPGRLELPELPLERKRERKRKKRARR